MGKKKGNGDGNAANEGGAENKASIKIDMHCDGCVRKIEECLWRANGVESLQTNREKNTVNVVGNKDMDPWKLIHMLVKKTKKNPQLLAPAPKKDQKENAGGDKKENPGNKPDQKKSEDEAGVLILKLDPPCDGCFKKSMKLIESTKGQVKKVEVSSGKDSITVKGSKKGLEFLKEKLPKTVKASPPPPPKKENPAAGKDNAGGAKKAEAGIKSPYEVVYPPGFHPEYGYPYGFHPAPGYPAGYGPVYPQGYGPVYPPGYGYGVSRPPPAPQVFSDENPNACSVM